MRPLRPKYFLLVLLFIQHTVAEAQILPPLIFEVTDQFPKVLRSERSVVVLDGSYSEEQVKELHVGLVQHGIDPIGYVARGELYAGPEVRRYFTNSFAAREVRVLIFTTFRDDGGIELWLTNFNGNVSFYDFGQLAHRVAATDMETAMLTLKRELGQTRQAMQNFLTLDEPYYLVGEVISGKKLIQNVNQDLKLDKLAIILPEKFQIPNDLPESEKAKIRAYNEELSRDSLEMAQIFADYPFEWGFVELPEKEDDLRLEGYQFILFGVSETGRKLKTSLNYQTSDQETDYVTLTYTGNIKTIPINQQVFKYYVKHIYSQDIFLGRDWDADLNWKDALRNHLAGIKKSIKAY